jgi:CheY-like chemotaxis protein
MNVWLGKKILIVDDSRVVQNDLRDKYRQIGLEIVGVVGDGISALESVKTLQPDLVSLDIIMPEMNGIEVFHEIKSGYPTIECFIVSCLSSEKKLTETYKDRYDLSVFFTKPLNVASLVLWLKKTYEHPAPHLRIAS